MNSFTTTLKSRAALSDTEVAECATLFSAHYGVWSARGPRPGARVAMSPAMLRRSCLFDDNCGAVLLRASVGGGPGELVGHAFFRRFEFGGAPAAAAAAAAAGPAVWVTQLVVASGARGRRVASTMLLQLCARDVVAVGLLSSHPHAVRALEHAAARRCSREGVAAAAAALAVAAQVPYFRAGDVDVEGGRCVARTGFFVDHAEVNAILASYAAAAGGRAFELGPLGEGEEFIAAVFF
jgi:hypothetical protein